MTARRSSTRANDGLDQLIGAQLSAVGAGISGRVAGAVALYRNRGRTEQDLRLAVGELFDVLEKIRPAVKAEMLRGDEADLFNIANSFTSRHLNEKQKGNYDSTLWHSLGSCRPSRWRYHEPRRKGGDTIP